MATFLDSYLIRFKRHLTYGKFLKCGIFEWEVNQRQIIYIDSPFHKLWIGVLISLNGAYVVFQAVNLFLGTYTVVDKLVAVFILAMYAFCFLFRLDFEKDVTPVEKLNRLISGLDPQPKVSQNLLRALKTLCILMEMTYWVWGLGAAAMTVFIPCKPPLLGPFLLCGRPKDSVSIWFVSLFLAGLEFLMGMQCCVAGGEYAVHFQLSGLVLLWGRCQEFITSMEMEVDNLLKGYRQLQIMEKIQNASFRGRILPIAIGGIPLLQVLGGYGIITLFHRVNPSQMCLFIIAYLDAACFSVTFLTAASLIYVRTGEWIKDTKSGGSGNNSYFRRVQKSFRPLRLEFGNNFVDRLTPLLMQEFCSRQTASILLLSGR